MRRRLLVFLWMASAGCLYAQSPQQKRLEQERNSLQREMNQINSLISEAQGDEKSAIAHVEELDRKIHIHEQIIQIIEQQTALTQEEILLNKDSISSQETELAQLKKEYEAIIRQSYKIRSAQNKLMFILSSEDFVQAYKRLRYLKQYGDYRKKQGVLIAGTLDKIKSLNKDLTSRLQTQNKLRADNEAIHQQLEEDRKKQDILINQIKQKTLDYKKQILEKKRESEALDKQIEKLIREAIEAEARAAAASAATPDEEEPEDEEKPAVATNKKNIPPKKDATPGSSSKYQFKLTPEGKTISKTFYKNKGKLIWPVQRGVVIHGYGEYRDPVYKNVRYFNSGITISCPKDEQARVVFDGVVSSILQVPGGSKAVQVRHGNYITTYYNLSEVFVKKGQKVYIRQGLGKINTSPLTGKTELKFFLYKDTNQLNPESWILKK